MGTNRRGFLGGLFSMGAAALGVSRVTKALAKPLEPEPVKTAYATNVFYVAGFQYHGGPDRIREMQEGDPIIMVMEPENIHDSFAVRLEWNGVMIGYVPRTENGVVNALLQQEAPLECCILEVSPDAEPWEAVLVQVLLVA